MLQPAPDLTGDWHITGATDLGTCPAGSATTLTSNEILLSVTQIDALLTVPFFSICGSPVNGDWYSSSTASGSVESNGTVSISVEFTQDANECCTRHGRHTIVGIVNEAGDTITGLETFTLEHAGCCDGWPPTCDVSGTFTATKCPPADCACPA